MSRPHTSRYDSPQETLPPGMHGMWGRGTPGEVPDVPQRVRGTPPHPAQRALPGRTRPRLPQLPTPPPLRGSSMNVDDVVQERIARAAAGDKARKAAREQLAAARKQGLIGRHRTKLTRVRNTEQIAMSIALAALRRDHQGVALLLASVPGQQGLQAASVALGAVSELALAASPDRIRTAIEAIRQAEALPSGGGES